MLEFMQLKGQGTSLSTPDSLTTTRRCQAVSRLFPGNLLPHWDARRFSLWFSQVGPFRRHFIYMNKQQTDHAAVFHHSSPTIIHHHCRPPSRNSLHHQKPLASFSVHASSSVCRSTLAANHPIDPSTTTPPFAPPELLDCLVGQFVASFIVLVSSPVIAFAFDHRLDRNIAPGPSLHRPSSLSSCAAYPLLKSRDPQPLSMQIKPWVYFNRDQKKSMSLSSRAACQTCPSTPSWRTCLTLR